MERHRGPRLDCAGPIGNGGAVERVFDAAARRDHSPAGGVVEARNPAGKRGPEPRQAQWTILASGSPMMSLAPASRNSGIKTLMSTLGTTVSTA